MNVLITGINGFVGSHLETFLDEKGFQVSGTLRRTPENENHFQLCLGESWLNILRATNPDVVIHCAHDLSSGSSSISVDGTSKWIREAKDYGVTRQIYLSSISAVAGTVSDYGRAKLRLEQIALDARCVVFRPGLIVGGGGVFGRLAKMATQNRVIPLISGGNTLTQWISIGELCHAVEHCLGQSDFADYAGKTFELHHGIQVRLRELLLEIGQNHRTGLIIPVPFWLVLCVVTAFEFIGIRPAGVTSENVRGLLQNHGYRKKSDLDIFGVSPTCLSRAVRDALTNEQ